MPSAIHPMKLPYFASLLLLLLASLCQAADTDKKKEKEGSGEKVYPTGYEDTPLISPGSPWKVHDLKRPAPPVVAPGTASSAPADAVIIFDGKNTDQLVGKNGAACPWKIDNGELVVAGGDIWTKAEFADCQIHLEWKSAPETKGNSQKKGNGGIFIMDRYENQILDCYNNPTYADGEVGAVYGQTPPQVNASRPPGEWQTYDIVFTAPKLENGKVVEPAYVTNFVNGICTQNHTKILGPTKHRQATDYNATFPEKAPIRLQDHKNDPPIRLRNIWVRVLKQVP